MYFVFFIHGFLEIFEKCSEIFEKYKNTYKDFCIFWDYHKKIFLGGLRPPLPRPTIK